MKTIYFYLNLMVKLQYFEIGIVITCQCIVRYWKQNGIVLCRNIYKRKIRQVKGCLIIYNKILYHFIFRIYRSLNLLILGPNAMLYKDESRYVHYSNSFSLVKFFSWNDRTFPNETIYFSIFSKLQIDLYSEL